MRGYDAWKLMSPEDERAARDRREWARLCIREDGCECGRCCPDRCAACGADDDLDDRGLCPDCEDAAQCTECGSWDAPRDGLDLCDECRALYPVCPLCNEAGHIDHTVVRPDGSRVCTVCVACGPVTDDEHERVVDSAEPVHSAALDTRPTDRP
jgi:hypothetical protein